MHKWKRWILLIIAFLFGLGGIYLAFTFLFMDFMVDLWWFKSLNYSGYFYLRLLYRYVVFLGGTLLFFLVFLLNFRLLFKYLKLDTSQSAGDKTGFKVRIKNFFRLFQKGSMKVYMPLSLIFAVPVGLQLYDKWEAVLLAIFGPATGTRDYLFNKDVGYYLFSLPLYVHVQKTIFIAFSAIFLLLLVVYGIEKRRLSRQEERLPKGAKIHITVIGFCVLLAQVWAFMLKRHELVYVNDHHPLFFGPGFLEVWYDLPMIWIVTILFVLTAISVVDYLYNRKRLKVLIILLAVFGVSVWLQNSSYIPDVLNKYYVKPNEVIREKPFIEKSILSTLAAYGLEKVEIREYRVQDSPDVTALQEVRQSLHNIPIWDRELLNDVYNQIQGIRSYFNFTNVDVGRYKVNGKYQQVYLSARELNLANLPESARNWGNMHLQYTHGYGIVMTPAAQQGDRPMTWYVKDIPMASDYGIETSQENIYYGLQVYDYDIVPNDIGEIDQSGKESNNLIHYDGRGGVPLSSLLRKLLFAVYFRDNNVFFTTKTNENSRILFRRNILESVDRLTPFFMLDGDPYVVLGSKGIYWIIDGYTYTDRYPYAEPYNNRFNYIRNAVKIVVDAYHGDISYYIADPADPVVKAYSRIYPGLLKKMDEMPSELKDHIRYPKDIFEIQMQIYAKYHQTDPEVFYRQEDMWDFAKLNNKPMKPYYMTLNLFEPDRQEFMLLSPMSPLNRDNLRSLALVGCDSKNYGKIIVYSFLKRRQVYGPSQISALIDQDTYIAQELTLWDQAGSEVKRGRMIVLPTANMILYIQPAYLSSATRLKIPELKRIIVCQGDVVAMDTSLELALQRLDEKLLENAQETQRSPMKAGHSRHGEKPQTHHNPAGHDLEPAGNDHGASGHEKNDDTGH